MDVAYSNAERLIRTELNAVETRASADAMKAADFEYYQFVATLDRRTCPICGERDGEVYPLSSMNQGENAPPMHPRCRCTIVASMEGGKQGRKTTDQRAAEKRTRVPADMSYRDWLKSLPAPPTGALNDKNDPDHTRREAHADRFYAARRNSRKMPWVRRVAQNSGMREAAVSKVFDHVFITEHDLWDGRHTFLPDYDMAESFRRLHEGRDIQPHDLILLKHEWLELGLMNRYGYDYDTAHEITSRKYNYKTALIEWYRERGLSWSG